MSNPTAATASGPVWLLVHVPKCAGRTVEAHLRAHLPAEAVLNPARRKAPARYVSRPYYVFPQQLNVARVRVVIGHFFGRSVRSLFAGREIRECVMIRDPLTFLISHYNFRMNRYLKAGKNRFPFDLWYKTRPLNPISHFLLHRYVEIPLPTLWRMPAADRLARLQDVADRFHFVASLTACCPFLTRLSGALEITPQFESRNVTSTKFVTPETLPSALRQQILDENPLDTLLYEKYKDRGWDASQVHPTTGDLAPDCWRTIRHDLTRPWHALHARWRRDVTRPLAPP